MLTTKTLTFTLDVEELPMIWHELVDVLELAVSNPSFSNDISIGSTFFLLKKLLPKDEESHAQMFNTTTFKDIKKP